MKHQTALRCLVFFIFVEEAVRLWCKDAWYFEWLSKQKRWAYVEAKVMSNRLLRGNVRPYSLSEVILWKHEVFTLCNAVKVC